MSALLRADGAERALLGGVMVWPERGAELWRDLEAEGLTPDDFAVPAIAAAAQACKALVARGEPLSTSTVLSEMSLAGREMIGGIAGIASLDGTATAHHVRAHAEIVRRFAHRRRVHRWHVEQAEEIVGNEDNCGPEEWQGYLDAAKADAANFASVGKASPTVSSEAVLQELHKDIADSAAGIKRGSSTGYPSLDTKYRPRGGHLVVKIGRPKMGKTSLALGMTCTATLERQSPHHAWEVRRDPIPVLWACDEMRNSELMCRHVAHVADVNARMLADPDKDWLKGHVRQIHEASKVIQKSSLEFISEQDCGRLERIFAAARTWRARQPIDERTGKKGPAWLFLDYLQRMTMAGIDKKANNEQRVAAMCKAAKTLARELDITVFLLAQLNRDCEKRDDKRPRSSDIRDSGVVEQEADAILGVYRPIVYEASAEQLRQRAARLRNPANAQEREELETIEAKLTDAEIIVCDNRHGPRGTAYVNFDGSRFRFSPRGSTHP